MTTLQDLLNEALRPRRGPYSTQSAVGALIDAERPFTGSYPRYTDADLQRLQDEQFAQASAAQAQRDSEAFTANIGRNAQVLERTPDPQHTPLERGVIDTSRMVLPGAYDMGQAGARIAQGEDAWGDFALNAGMAALPFLGVGALRGERAPPVGVSAEDWAAAPFGRNAVGMRDPNTRTWMVLDPENIGFGHHRDAPAPASSATLPSGDVGVGQRAILRSPGPDEYDVYHGTPFDFEQFAPVDNPLYSSRGEAGVHFFSSSPHVASDYATDSAQALGGRAAQNNPAWQAANRQARDAIIAKRRAITPWTRSARERDWQAAEDIRQSVVRDSTAGANVRPSRIRLSNPLLIESIDEHAPGAFKQAIQEARASGNDGVIFRAVRDAPNIRRRSDVYAVFDPSQIRPRFDPSHIDTPTPSPDAGQAQVGQPAYLDSLRRDGFNTDRIWYHGTASDFDAFDRAFIDPTEEYGFAFSSSPEVAKDYAEAAARRSGGSPRVVPVYLRERTFGRADRAGEPYTADVHDMLADEFDSWSGEYGPRGMIFENMPDRVSSLSNQFNNGSLGEHVAYVFDPREIRPAQRPTSPLPDGSHARPPDGSPKSLTRRKPPHSGGFTVFGAPR